ncbi:hypothetical protein M3182_18955 [Mesobacillus maritimus]|uniref:hypothetical protein n=1 Tax=Mesobacillus maritimus TaxID=1643336 RepID=UPI00203F6892|nr:hypothetical protein [Mesobacillus maritimus]MCM3587809.1 hypothetical protein [Mesobacillus maritimus]
MNIEDMVADELQCMFLEEKLCGVKEEELNRITRKIRRREITISELIRQHPMMKEKVKDAMLRIAAYAPLHLS